jgi:hypothetical protein
MVDTSLHNDMLSFLEAGKVRFFFSSNVSYPFHHPPPSVLVLVMPAEWDWRVRIQNSSYLMEASSRGHVIA